MTSEGKRRWKDFWQLHLPLIVVVAFCAFATVIEYRRANEGVGRAWVYTFQWPIIAIFAVVIWNRYRKHGSVTSWFTDYYRNRIARLEEEKDEAVVEEPSDPETQAWKAYVADLQRRDPPGGPPSAA